MYIFTYSKICNFIIATEFLLRLLNYTLQVVYKFVIHPLNLVNTEARQKLNIIRVWFVRINCLRKQKNCVQLVHIFKSYYIGTKQRLKLPVRQWGDNKQTINQKEKQIKDPCGKMIFVSYKIKMWRLHAQLNAFSVLN